MRNFYIDILRGFAVLFVLGAHLDNYLDPRFPWLDPILNSWKMGGWQGVDMFFVISGFLVSGLLFKEFQAANKIDAIRFLVRRGFKIYPVYYIFLALTPWLAWYEFDRLGYLTEALFIQNYTFKIWGHTWSLAVEEHFYFLLSFIFYILSRSKDRPFKNLPKMILIIALSVLFLRYLTYYLLPFKNMTHRFATHLRIDSLSFGVFISYLYHFQKERFASFVMKYRLYLFTLGALLILPNFILPVYEDKIWGPVFFSLIYLGFGAILASLLFIEYRRTFINSVFWPVSRIGLYSYSIYIWHMPIQYWCEPAMRKFFGYGISPIEKVGIYVLAAIIVGIASSRIIENSFLKIRENYFPSRRMNL